MPRSGAKIENKYKNKKTVGTATNKKTIPLLLLNVGEKGESPVRTYGLPRRSSGDWPDVPQVELEAKRGRPEKKTNKRCSPLGTCERASERASERLL